MQSGTLPFGKDDPVSTGDFGRLVGHDYARRKPRVPTPETEQIAHAVVDYRYVIHIVALR
jgi:hypothetical protein